MTKEQHCEDGHNWEMGTFERENGQLFSMMFGDMTAAEASRKRFTVIYTCADCPAWKEGALYAEDEVDEE